MAGALAPPKGEEDAEEKPTIGFKADK
jgi:hypothetical protein